MDKKTIRNDIILIGSLLLVMVIALIVILVTRQKDNLVATITVRNEVVETIDLEAEQEADYFIEGTHGTVHVHVKDGAIAVIESNCPHQDCVHMGYISESNRPIICAYNEVYIVINGKGDMDVEIK